MRQLWWITPFIFFLLGYGLLSLLFQVKTVEVPALLGKPLVIGLRELSQHHLSAYISNEQEDAKVPAGTILSQMPSPQQRIKEQQSVGLVISKQPDREHVPSFLMMSHKDAVEKATLSGIKLHEHQLEHTASVGSCYAQYPPPGAELRDNRVHLYRSAGTTPLRLMPQLRGTLVAQLQEWLPTTPVRVSSAGFEGQVAIFFNQAGQLVEAPDPQAHVVEQHPAAGTIIDRAKPLRLQLIIACPPE